MCIIKHSGCKYLTAVITYFYQCDFSLSLYNNQITDVGAKYVAKLIEECSSLEYVKYVGFFFPFCTVLIKVKQLERGGRVGKKRQKLYLELNII